jgi:hypothetical protein
MCVYAPLVTIGFVFATEVGAIETLPSVTMTESAFVV